jgi:hypothetical protein
MIDMYIILFTYVGGMERKREKIDLYMYIYILRRRNERETTRTMREAKITLIIMCWRIHAGTVLEYVHVKNKKNNILRFWHALNVVHYYY